MYRLHGCLLLLGLLVPVWPARAQDHAELVRRAAPEFTAEPSRRRDPSGALLPEGAVARLGTGYLRHLNAAAAFTADGRRLLTWSSVDRAIRLWDLAGGKELRRLTTTNTFWSGMAALAPDGKTLAVTCRYGVVVLLDAATGKELRRLQAGGVDPYYYQAAFSPDGTVLATSAEGNEVRLWNPATGRLLRKLTGEPEAITLGMNLAFSADGKRVIGPCGHLWETATGARAWTPPRGERQLQRLPAAFTPDARLLAVAGLDNQIRLFDLDLKELRCCRGYDQRVLTVALSPDGKWLAAGGMGGRVHVWDTATGREIRRLTGPREATFVVRFSPDGKRLLALGQDARFYLWEMATGQVLHPFTGHPDRLMAVGFSADGKRVATGGYDGAVCLWEARGGRLLHRLAGHPNYVNGVAFSPDGQWLASCGPGGGLRLWAVATGKQVRHLRDKDAGVGPAFSPDGKWLAFGQNTVRLVEAATGREVRRWDEPGSIFSLAFAPDGRTLAAGKTGYVVSLRDPARGKQLRQFSMPFGHTQTTGALSFSPDGQTLAAAGRRQVAHRLLLWDVATGKARNQFQGKALYVRQAVFSGDGRLLATDDESGHVCLWELATGGRRHTFRPAGGDVLGLVFSPAGLLASGHADGSVYLWDVVALDRQAPAAVRPLTAAQREALWKELGSPDAEKAYRALRTLIAVPGQSVPWLSDRLAALHAAGLPTLKQALAGLDDRRYAVREQAVQDLERLGKTAEPALRRLLNDTAPLEARRRAEALLARLEKREGKEMPAEWLQALRAVEILERVGNREARQLLARYADSSPETWLSQQARAAWQRLGR